MTNNFKLNMKGFLITILLSLICFKANAISNYTHIPLREIDKNNTIDVNGDKISYEEIYNKYFDWKDKATEDEVIYITRHTLFCDTREAYKKGYVYAQRSNGKININVLNNMDCSMVGNFGNGTLIGREKNSSIIQIIFEDSRVEWLRSGYFDEKTLMTVTQAKERYTIN